MKWYYKLAYRRTTKREKKLGCRYIIRRPRWFWTLFINVCLLTRGSVEVPLAADNL